MFFLDVVQQSCFEVYACAGGNGSKRASRQHLSAGAVHHVNVAIAIGMNENFAVLSVDRQIQQNVFVHRVIVEKIVRTELVKPDCFSRVRISRENSSRELVVSRAGIGVPWSRVCRAVINKVKFWIVRDPTPYTAATDLPRVWRPRLHP